jgi:uncharacterized protein YegP (UPF0339 family)
VFQFPRKGGKPGDRRRSALAACNAFPAGVGLHPEVGRPRRQLRPVQTRESEMAGWFELSKSTSGQFRFVLKAANAKTVLTSQMYKSAAAAKNGIASVQSHCAKAANFEKKVATNGQPYFTLNASNKQVIGNSQMYASTTARDAGIESVRTIGRSATIKDLT